MVCTASQVRTTADFTSTAPVWTNKTGNLTGTIVDADKPVWANNKAYVLTTDGIWRTDDLGSAVPTWIKIYDAPAVEPGLPGYGLRRIRCAKSYNKVYALAVADTEDSNTYDVHLLVTINGGLTWGRNPVGTTSGISTSQFYDDEDYHSESKPAGVFYKHFGYQIDRQDNANDEGKNPWAIVLESGPTVDPQSQYWDTSNHTMSWRRDTAFAPLTDFVHTNDGGTIDGNHIVAMGNPSLNAEQKGRLETWLDNKFGSGAYTIVYSGTFQLPRDAARTWIGVRLYGTDVAWEGHFKTHVVWRKDAEPDIPVSLDVGAHNGMIVYVGLSNKVVRTDDGGRNWTDYVTLYGANDLECHAAQPRGDHDLNILTTGGKLFRVMDTDPGPEWLTETPSILAMRIASDPLNSWPMFVIKSGTELVRIDADGTETTLRFSLVNGRSVQYRYGENRETRLLYLIDSTTIQYSDDHGATFAANKAWEGYSDGVVIIPISKVP